MTLDSSKKESASSVFYRRWSIVILGVFVTNRPRGIGNSDGIKGLVVHVLVLGVFAPHTKSDLTDQQPHIHDLHPQVNWRQQKRRHRNIAVEHIELENEENAHEVDESDDCHERPQPLRRRGSHDSAVVCEERDKEAEQVENGHLVEVQPETVVSRASRRKEDHAPERLDAELVGEAADGPEAERHPERCHDEEGGDVAVGGHQEHRSHHGRNAEILRMFQKTPHTHAAVEGGVQRVRKGLPNGKPGDHHEDGKKNAARVGDGDDDGHQRGLQEESAGERARVGGGEHVHVGERGVGGGDGRRGLVRREKRLRDGRRVVVV